MNHQDSTDTGICPKSHLYFPLRRITNTKLLTCLIISKDSKQTVMPAYFNRDNKDKKIVQRRWKYVPHIIPGVTSKEFNFKDNTAHIKKAINTLS